MQGRILRNRYQRATPFVTRTTFQTPFRRLVAIGESARSVLIGQGWWLLGGKMSRRRSRSISGTRGIQAPAREMERQPPSPWISELLRDGRTWKKTPSSLRSRVNYGDSAPPSHRQLPSLEWQLLHGIYEMHSISNFRIPEYLKRVFVPPSQIKGRKEHG